MKIGEPSIPSEIPDESTNKWENDLDKQKHEQLLDYRKQYVDFAIGITQTWVGLLFIIVMCQVVLKRTGYCLTANEFIGVFGGSTFAIFGYAAILGKFLFPKGGFSNDWGSKISNKG